MKKKKIDKYLIICILATIVGFGIIFAIGGIYPFGHKTINLTDFDSGYIPVYYKLWDVIHLRSTPYFDWNLGAGLNAFGSLIGNGFISPICWLIAIFPRSSIPYTISYIYLIKIVFISIMTYIGFGKIFPDTKGIYKLIFTLIYTFSGFMFIMSTNLLYLDSIALFPLLVYSLKELVEKGKWKLYTILLTLTLLMSYYIAWLDLMFIIGTTGISLLVIKTDNKKQKAVKVLLCTLLSLLLSCVLFLPGFMFARTSARMASNTSEDSIFGFFVEKATYLLTISIPLVLTIKQLLVKKDKKKNIFILLMVLLLTLGVFVEPINALWHTGSHSGFALRYGYQIIFFMSLVSIYYLNNNYKPNNKTAWFKLIIPIILMINIIVLFFVSRERVYYGGFFATGEVKTAVFLLLLIVFLLYILSYIFILKNSEKKALILTIILLIMQSLSFGHLYMQFFPKRTAFLMQELKDNFELANDGYNYVIDSDDDNLNFPYIVEVPSMENRIHFVEQSELDERDYFGFNGIQTAIQSSGGNIFTNALMLNKYYITDREYDNNYELVSKKKDNYYYKSKNNLSLLIPYNGKEYSIEEKDIYKNSNQIYETLFDGKKDIFTKMDTKLKDNYVILNVKKGKKYTAYIELDLDKFSDNSTLDFEYNDKELTNFYERPLLSFKTLLEFESKVDGEVRIHFSSLACNYAFYEVNYDEFKSFIDKYGNEDVKVLVDGVKKIYTYNANKDTSVLIPTNYTDNYEIKVNGKKVEYKKNLYNKISIDVKKGNNKIEIEYKQKWFSMGIKISLVTLLVFVFIQLLNKKFKLLDKKIVLYPLFLLSFIIFAFFIIKIYILSLF